MFIANMAQERILLTNNENLKTSCSRCSTRIHMPTNPFHPLFDSFTIMVGIGTGFTNPLCDSSMSILNTRHSFCNNSVKVLKRQLRLRYVMFCFFFLVINYAFFKSGF